MDLKLNNFQPLICHKTKSNQRKLIFPHLIFLIYITLIYIYIYRRTRENSYVTFCFGTLHIDAPVLVDQQPLCKDTR